MTISRKTATLKISLKHLHSPTATKKNTNTQLVQQSNKDESK